MKDEILTKHTRRYRDTSVLRTDLTAMDEHDESRAGRNRAAIRGLHDGNRPYTASELKANNLSGRTNVNWRDAEHLMDQFLAGYSELINTTARPGITINLNYRHRMVQEMSYYHRSLVPKVVESEMWASMMEWPSFLYEMLHALHDIGLFGMAIPWWDHPTDWQFSVPERGSVLIPADAELTGKRIDRFAIKSELKLTELWALIDTPEQEASAAAVGWNVELVKAFLIYLEMGNSKQGTSTSYSLTTWEATQNRLRNNDIGAGCSHDPVSIYHSYVKESDGKWQHRIITKLDLAKSHFKNSITLNDPDDPEAGALYVSKHRYDELEEILNPLFYEVTSRQLRGIKGLGHKSYAPLVAINQHKCHMVDASQAMSSVFLEGATAGDIEALNRARIGPYTVLPGNMRHRQVAMSGMLDGPTNVLGMMSRTLESHAMVGRTSAEVPMRDIEREQIWEKQRQQGERVQMDRFRAFVFYLALDRVYQELYRRFWIKMPMGGESDPKSRERFKAACELRGVPKEYLEDPTLFKIAARRVTMDRAGIYGRLNQLRGEMDEVGRRSVTYDEICDLVGDTTAERYYMPYDRDRIPSTTSSIIALENSALRRGEELPVGLDQEHRPHIQGHAEMIVPLMQQFQQGQLQVDPREVLPVAAASRAHIRLHAEAIQGVLGMEEVAKLATELDQRLMRWQAQVESQVREIQERENREQEKQMGEQAAVMQQMIQARVEQAMAAHQAKLEIGLDWNAKKEAIERDKKQREESAKGQVQGDR